MNGKDENPGGPGTRSERRAQGLRANLAKRKAQQRARRRANTGESPNLSPEKNGLPPESD